jgi:hypothetical protein
VAHESHQPAAAVAEEPEQARAHARRVGHALVVLREAAAEARSLDVEPRLLQQHEVGRARADLARDRLHALRHRVIEGQAVHVPGEEREPAFRGRRSRLGGRARGTVLAAAERGAAA